MRYTYAAKSYLCHPFTHVDTYRRTTSSAFPCTLSLPQPVLSLTPTRRQGHALGKIIERLDQDLQRLPQVRQVLRFRRIHVHNRLRPPVELLNVHVPKEGQEPPSGVGHGKTGGQDGLLGVRRGGGQCQAGGELLFLAAVDLALEGLDPLDVCVSCECMYGCWYGCVGVIEYGELIDLERATTHTIKHQAQHPDVRYTVSRFLPLIFPPAILPPRQFTYSATAGG